MAENGVGPTKNSVRILSHRVVGVLELTHVHFLLRCHLDPRVVARGRFCGEISSDALRTGSFEGVCLNEVEGIYPERSRRAQTFRKCRWVSLETMLKEMMLSWIIA
jgi:hypothetical protein